MNRHEIFPNPDMILFLLLSILEASSARINVAAAKPGLPMVCASVRKETKKPWELPGSTGTLVGTVGSQNGWDNHSLEDTR
jgi:hypothetical protein